jgi:hypothetical protein
MKAIVTGSSLLMFVVACTTDPASPTPGESAADREALAELGIADVHVDGDRVVLDDASGARLGELRFDVDGSVASSFRGHVAVTQVTASGMNVSCDGRGLSLAATSGGVAHPEVLAGCDEALRVASILVRPGAPHQTDALFEEGPCHQAFIDGCVDWNIEQGCIQSMICNVRWCSNGWSDYQCLLY